MENNQIELATLEEIQAMASMVLEPGCHLDREEIIEEYRDMYSEAAKLRLTVDAMDMKISSLAGLEGYPKAIKDVMDSVADLIDMANGDTPELTDKESKELETKLMSELGLDGDVPDTTTADIEYEDWESELGQQ